MPPTIDVIIPTYGGWDLTAGCLRHLAAQTAQHRVIVADNASPDDTVARLRAEFPAVTLIALDENRGFAAACNRGIAAGDGEVVVLLNNDVDAEPELLAQLAEPFAEDARLGSVAALLLRPDGRIDSAGLCADATLAGFPRLQGLPPSAADSPRPALLGPAGAAAAYRRSALDRVGPLDEGIFMYQEDLDLALRLRAAGWRTRVAVRARAVHHGSATAGRRSASQRRRAGFARGYLLRTYGVGRSRHGPRALLTEAVVAGGDLVLSRDAAALTGRLAGWRAARAAARRSVPAEGIDRTIGLRESLRLRRADYAVAASPAHAAPGRPARSHPPS